MKYIIIMTMCSMTFAGQGSIGSSIGSGIGLALALYIVGKIIGTR